MTSADLERFTSGAAIGVDVAAIERDLAALWRQAANGHRAVTRACSWNLVVHVDSEPALERGKMLADALVERVPSRTLVLHHRPNATTGPEVEAFVTANCKLLPGGGKLLCSEEITVQSRGQGSDYLPSLTRALLVPDIPTAVLCAGLPKDSALVQELVSAADRLILDSHGADHLGPVERLGKALPRVADLAWLRSAPWRLAVAAAFDGHPERLDKLTRVRVRCEEASVSEARLLLGWLGARLGWGQVEDGFALRGQGRVRLDLEAREGPGVRVEFEAEGGAKVVAETHHAPLADEALVTAALGARGLDKLYQAALRRAVELEA
ncbi:MAG: glucose-6-phosphate dehydrogenase assembly protein OpcA [Myxococcota bacterium]